MIMFSWDKASEVFPPISRHLLLGGGVAYTVGIIFFVLGNTQPIYHTIWHLFVLVGAICHWFSVQYMLEDVGMPGRASWPLYERPFMRVRTQLNNQWMESMDTLGNMSNTIPSEFHAVAAILRSGMLQARGFVSEL
jgi:hypothetical protein